MSLINRARFAGRWYRDDPEALHGDLLHFRSVAAAVGGGARDSGAGAAAGPVSLAVLPHAGLSFSGRGIAHAFLPPQPPVATTVLILSPSHYAALTPDVLVAESFSSHETPLGAVPGSPSFSQNLLKEKSISLRVDNALVEGEHGTEMFLPFIRQWMGASAVSMILVPEFSAPDVLERWADGVLSALSREGVQSLMVIASSDFTHYGDRFGYTPFGKPGNGTRVPDAVREDDEAVAHMVSAGDSSGIIERMRRPITVCGRHAILLSLAIRRRLIRYGRDLTMPGRVVDYYTSLDAAGRRDDDFVCYASILWRE